MNYRTGSIDDIRFYDRALSAAEVARDYEVARQSADPAVTTSTPAPHRALHQKVCDRCGAASRPMLPEVLEAQLEREGWRCARDRAGRDLCPVCAAAPPPPPPPPPPGVKPPLTT